MEKFYYAYEDLKYKIKKYGLFKCQTDIDNMLQTYSGHHNIGLVLLKKAQLEKYLKNEENAEKLYIQILNNYSGDVKLYATRDLFRLYIIQRRMDDALDLFKTLDELEMDKYSLSFSKALLLRGQNNYIESSKIVAGILKEADRIDDLNILQNCILEIEKNYWDDFKRKNYQAIKSVMKRLIIDSNRDVKAKRKLQLAQLEQINTNYLDALKIYRSLLSNKNPKIRSSAIVGICKVYLSLGDENILNCVEFDELKTYDFPEAVYLTSQIYSMNRDFEQALKVLDSQPVNGRIDYEKARVYRACNNLEQAINLFNKCYRESDSFTLKTATLFNMIYIFIDLNNYEQAFALLTENKEQLMNLDKNSYYQTYAFLCKYFNIEYDCPVNSYSVSQILNYSFELACEHIKKHVNEFKEILNFDGDISELLLDIKDRLSIRTYLTLTLFDVYNVKFVGKDGRDTFIKTIVIPGTKNIITCFPSKETLFVLDDMDEEISNKPKEKIIKRKSQIDKFNERYNLKRD